MDSTVTTGVQSIHLYVNRVESSYTVISTGSFPMPAASSNQYIYLGAREPTSTTSANGVIDELKIYDQVIP